MNVPVDEPDLPTATEAAPSLGTSPAVAPERAGATEVRFHHSADFAQVLKEVGCSLLVSTYQAGQLMGVGVDEEEVVLTFRQFDRAMGIAVGAERMALAGKMQIWSLQNHSELAAAIEPLGRYDSCWLPRSSTVTGGIQCHEIAWGGSGTGGSDLWIVNTLFSCLAGLDPRHSFVPRWRPPFISQLAPQDRCHLNGLAMRDGSPAFVTVMAVTDEPVGWRNVSKDHGAVLDVASGEAVTTGLTMPHSPRWHDGGLFVLNSGWGRLERVDLATGHRDVVAVFPGYTRGLALHGDLAFVGLSRIRETATFGRTPIAAYRDELKCGVGVIELETGRTVATLQFANAVEEIFDVQAVPSTRCLTFGGSPDESDEIWLLPARQDRRSDSVDV